MLLYLLFSNLRKSIKDKKIKKIIVGANLKIINLKMIT